MANEKHLTILAEATELTEHEIQEDLEKPESETPYHILTVYDGLRCLELLQSEHDKEMEGKDCLAKNIADINRDIIEAFKIENAICKSLIAKYEETIRQLRGEIEGLKKSLQTHLNNNY